MPDQVEQLVESLLYEGYALYPYTPSATKNATPTPFGIVYPPRYAKDSPVTYDHLELRCLARAEGGAGVIAEVRFLAPVGDRHRAAAFSATLPPLSLAELAATPAGSETRFGELVVGLELSARPAEGDTFEVALRVENRTACGPSLDRPNALARSLVSTHPMLRIAGGRFLSPIDSECECINTFAVLATEADDAVLGAAIVLPDHPQLAPESRGGLFDSTEIEEALLLHVQTLSDGELDDIARADPAVAQMVARAAAATPADISALHGRVTLRDPVSEQPPEPPPGLVDPSAGQEQAEVGDVTFHRGGRVRLRPGPDADLHARLLEGRTATIERIFVDYDGKTHLGVTVDDDPGQELMRETNRFLFFFAPEVEVIER